VSMPRRLNLARHRRHRMPLLGTCPGTQPPGKELVEPLPPTRTPEARRCWECGTATALATPCKQIVVVDCSQCARPRRRLIAFPTSTVSADNQRQHYQESPAFIAASCGKSRAGLTPVHQCCKGAEETFSCMILAWRIALFERALPQADEFHPKWHRCMLANKGPVRKMRNFHPFEPGLRSRGPLAVYGGRCMPPETGDFSSNPEPIAASCLAKMHQTSSCCNWQRPPPACRRPSVQLRSRNPESGGSASTKCAAIPCLMSKTGVSIQSTPRPTRLAQRS
jgi:hypothetical protein